ncbi:MAG: hypothetical protein SFY80_15935 [Verrucomicrobiota bacterium]|nr:hypothetical protein [Verrucomicrobiota bacterium]
MDSVPKYSIGYFYAGLRVRNKYIGRVHLFATGARAARPLLSTRQERGRLARFYQTLRQERGRLARFYQTLRQERGRLARFYQHDRSAGGSPASTNHCGQVGRAPL